MDITYVDDYCENSSSSSSKEEEMMAPRWKRRRVTRVWEEQETYPSPKEAEAVVQSRQIWKIASSTQSYIGWTASTTLKFGPLIHECGLRHISGSRKMSRCYNAREVIASNIFHEFFKNKQRNHDEPAGESPTSRRKVENLWWLQEMARRYMESRCVLGSRYVLVSIFHETYTPQTRPGHADTA